MRKKLRTEQLVAHHRKQSSELTRVKKRAAALQRILQELHDSFMASRGYCACCQLNATREMLEDALAAYFKLYEHGDDSDSESEDEGMSLLGRLRENCRRLSVAEHVFKQREEFYAG